MIDNNNNNKMMIEIMMMLLAKCEQMRHQLYLKRVSPGRVDTIGNLKWHISDILYFPLHTAWRYAP